MGAAGIRRIAGNAFPGRRLVPLDLFFERQQAPRKVCDQDRDVGRIRRCSSGSMSPSWTHSGLPRGSGSRHGSPPCWLRPSLSKTAFQAAEKVAPGQKLCDFTSTAFRQSYAAAFATAVGQPLEATTTATGFSKRFFVVGKSRPRSTGGSGTVSPPAGDMSGTSRGERERFLSQQVMDAHQRTRFTVRSNHRDGH